MINRPVTITAPSRLHFGLLSFGNSRVRQYGGVGVMIEQPNTVLVAESSTTFSVVGPSSDRVAAIAARWHRYYQEPTLCHCRLLVQRVPDQHVGLGVGTQLALAVATALLRVTRRPTPPLDTLARSVGRGARSSIGSYGFRQGGLLFETGKFPDEPFAQLEARVELPAAWRILLICPDHQPGLSGQDEDQAFERLPTVSPSVTDQLTDEVQSALLPAARAGNLTEFGESVYRYGVRAGACFASHQGGPFASELLGSWVERIRRRGFPGVGQSSWGPSLFVFHPDQDSAEECLRWFRQDVLSGDYHVKFVVSPLNNHGARIE